jgi:hypothetical protein
MRRCSRPFRAWVVMAIRSACRAEEAVRISSAAFPLQTEVRTECAGIRRATFSR